jgi:hypothetical protein
MCAEIERPVNISTETCPEECYLHGSTCELYDRCIVKFPTPLNTSLDRSLKPKEKKNQP